MTNKIKQIIVHLTIACGNVECIEDVDVAVSANQKASYIYKVIAETHASLPLILIRNIKKPSNEE
jgi:hypothetical protein